MSAVESVRLSCIAVDDEPFALKLIADDFSKIPFLNLIQTFSSAPDALKFLENNSVDLLFLDIQMPGLTGMQVLRSLKKQPMVIMTTTYEQYAVEGFNLNVIDHLVKPISFDRLLIAANKALHQFKLEKTASVADDGHFFIHSEYKEIKILFNDVLYIEGFKDYVKIFLTTQAPPILTRLNLKAIGAKLEPSMFSRLHNSFIVSLPKIDSFQKAQVFIRSKSIPIGDKYAESFRSKYSLRQ